MATTPTALSEKPPAASGYDPTSAQPYSPSGGGQPSGPPPAVAPPPNPMTQEPAPKAPAVVPNAGGRAAGIAYGLDAVLRGFVKGRDQAQQQSAAQVNRLLQGYGYAYKSASDQYL